MRTNGDKRLLQGLRASSSPRPIDFQRLLHGRYGLGVAARATPTPDTCRRSRGGSRARRGAAELSLIYAGRRRVVQAVPASPGVRSPLKQFLERLLVLAQLLGCLPAYDEREERLSDSMRLEDRQDPSTSVRNRQRARIEYHAQARRYQPPPSRHRSPQPPQPEHLNFLAAGYSCRKPALPRPGTGHIDKSLCSHSQL